MKSQPTEPLDEELLPPPRPQRIDESVVSVATYCTRCRAYGSTHPAAFNTRRLPRCGCGGIMVEVAPGAEQFTHFPQTKPDHCGKEPSPPPLDPAKEFETYCEP